MQMLKVRIAPEPAVTEIPPSIEGGTDDPVDVHGIPHTGNTQSKTGKGQSEEGERILCQHISTAHPENPHANGGNQKGEFDIAGRSENMGQTKTQGPDK